MSGSLQPSVYNGGFTSYNNNNVVSSCDGQSPCIMRKDSRFSFQSTYNCPPVTEFRTHNRRRSRGSLFNRTLVSASSGFSSLPVSLFERYRSTRPQDHKSARMGLYKHLGPSGCLPISGAIHPGVPHQRSINVSGPSTRTAISKSIMNSRLETATMFWGLISRWAIPWRCRNATPSTNWWPKFSISLVGNILKSNQ